MATKPLTSEAIALTEKKMDMSLDDIIKMSKTSTAKSNKKQRELNKNQRPFNSHQDKSLKIRQYMDSRSTVRRGVLSQRRTNFQGNSFPSASEAARKVAMTHFHNRVANRTSAANWNRQRPRGPSRQQGKPSNGSNFIKRQPVQQPPQSTEVMHKQTPKTLDSLFANMKEQRMRAFPHSNNGNGSGGVRRHGGGGNQPRQPWLRGRFGNYRN